MKKVKLIAKSEALGAAFETAVGMHKAKIISDRQFEQFRKDCLMPATPDFDGDKITALRKRLDISQEMLARALNVSRSSVQQWESNKRRPCGSCCKLLGLIERNGMKAVYC